jgi:iron-sulfur cluster assembly protein
MADIVTMTDLAAAKVAEALNGSEGYLRLRVHGGGCAGFRYQLAIDQHRDGDHVFKHDNGTVIVDDTSLPYVVGAVIDYKQEGLLTGFEVNNPHAVSACGCGSSFRVDEKETDCGSAL